MCLTVHWIDIDWKLNKRILNFCPISSHKGDELDKAVDKCLIEWEIENVFTITVDNASSNDKMLQYLRKKINNWRGSMLDGKFLHMRCIAHVINLVVSDDLKDIGDSINRIRWAVRYIRQSPSRLAKFKTCIVTEKLVFTTPLCLDVCTRWNSTYLMLAAAQQYEKAFDTFFEEDPNFRTEEDKYKIPMENDWANARRLCTLLKKFYDLTLRVSGSLYVTSNTHVDEIGNVLVELKNCMQSDDLNMRSITVKMRERYDKYWKS